ncbi:MAG: hypothetical protein K2H16_01045 [Prevotella sp.]|nr:hypothetical protein [Prevotella sp.]
MKHKAYSILTLLMSAVMLASCIDVEEELSSNGNSVGTIHYTGTAPKDIPLYTVAIRLVNFTSIQKTFDKGALGDVSVPSGQYKSYGFSSGDFTSAHQTAVSSGEPFSELYISQATYTGTYGSYNSYSDYVNTLKTPLSICSSSVYDIHSGTKTSVPMRFKTVSLQLNVNFSIRKEQGAEPYIIEKVETELSGVPSRIDILSGNIDCTETHNVAYTTAVTADKYTSTLLACKGNMEILSLTAPENSSATEGPGILQAHIHVLTQSGIRKVLHGQINLYNTIRNARIATYSPDASTLTNNVRTATLNIAAECTVDGDGIKVKSGSGDRWKQAETGI